MLKWIRGSLSVRVEGLRASESSCVILLDLRWVGERVDE